MRSPSKTEAGFHVLVTTCAVLASRYHIVATHPRPFPGIFMANLRFRGRLNASAALLVLFSALTGCERSKPQAKAPVPPSPQVTVAKPVRRLVSDRDEYVGRFVAVDCVEVRARVSGYLDAVHFKDGQLVKKGDLLFTIDRRPFQASLTQAQGKPRAGEGQPRVRRGGSGARRGPRARQHHHAADVRSAHAGQARRGGLGRGAGGGRAPGRARSRVHRAAAPISGRIGDRRVSVGNLVTGGTTGTTTLLATITSIDPIRFEFTMDEASYLRYMRLAGDSASAANRGINVPVRLKLIDESQVRARGQDRLRRQRHRPRRPARSAAAPSSPTPRARSRPACSRASRCRSGAPAEALLVPDAAIGTEQVRKFVLVVDAENVARPKYVTLGPVVDGLRVVTAGLEPDDRVIVNGLMRVRPGVKVTPQAVAGDAPCIRKFQCGRLDTRSRNGQLRLRSPMRISRFFIDRPIFAGVVSLVFVILGDRVVRPAAGRPVSGDRAAGGQRHRPVSRRQRRRGGRDRRHAARAADQRRREHALHHVELDGRRPLLHRGHVRARHQSRHRPGAGAEPRGGRPAAPAGRRAQHRRHGAPRRRPT